MTVSEVIFMKASLCFFANQKLKLLLVERPTYKYTAACGQGPANSPRNAQ